MNNKSLLSLLSALDPILNHKESCLDDFLTFVGISLLLDQLFLTYKYVLFVCFNRNHTSELCMAVALLYR